MEICNSNYLDCNSRKFEKTGILVVNIHYITGIFLSQICKVSKVSFPERLSNTLMAIILYNS